MDMDGKDAEPYLKGEQLPPTYTESATLDVRPPSNAALSSSSGHTPPLAYATNFLTIFRENNSISGKYTIARSMSMPPGAVPSVGDDGKKLNMRVASQNGSVDVVIELDPSADTKGPARLQADSRNGSVAVTVHDKGLNRFRLKASSRNGSVSVRIPPTYFGTVSTGLKNGQLAFSPAVQARLTTFSERDGDGNYFIGDYASSGYQGDTTWLGDHLRVESENGRVSVDFVNE
ncbi:hypothetical protein JB92DRAFT_3144481 [Gautieria morchelliformis]|nr:hypothetical protein JB92DRAFT_3144481 [Gautieria morchelliformis]